MVHDQFNEEIAQIVVTYGVFGFEAEAKGSDLTAYCDVHVPDEPRYFNVTPFLCWRAIKWVVLANQLILPKEHKGSCYKEFQFTFDSWGSVSNEMDEITNRL